MEPTRTAYGTWSGGRFMHFGVPLEEERYIGVIRRAYERGIRTFMTSDVYGNGQADELLGRALAGLPRESYCLAGAVGHDFYEGKREGAKGYPRFTQPALRGPEGYEAYLRSAAEKALQRCRANCFDLLLLHNPDSIGYSSLAVWEGMSKVKEAGLTKRLGIAPGPANGFTLDMIGAFEKFEGIIDWAMIILNPFEVWPGSLVLPAARKHQVKIITRVVDYGGLFHDDVKPGHQFPPQDHRSFRPAGWIDAGVAKLERIRGIAKEHGLTMLQLACIWNLSQPGVESVIPTMIQEIGPESKTIETKVDELAALPNIRLSDEESRAIAEIGNNKGCMSLKGANPAYANEPLPDLWSITPGLDSVAQRWGIDPKNDLAYLHPVASP